MSGLVETFLVVCDGIEWALEIFVGDKEITSKGCAAYPSNGTDVASEQFKQELRAFGELIDNKEFIRD